MKKNKHLLLTTISILYLVITLLKSSTIYLVNNYLTHYIISIIIIYQFLKKKTKWHLIFILSISILIDQVILLFIMIYNFDEFHLQYIYIYIYR
jgi:hypothetical protein